MGMGDGGKGDRKGKEKGKERKEEDFFMSGEMTRVERKRWFGGKEGEERNWGLEEEWGGVGGRRVELGLS